MPNDLSAPLPASPPAAKQKDQVEKTRLAFLATFLNMHPVPRVPSAGEKAERIKHALGVLAQKNPVAAREMDRDSALAEEADHLASALKKARNQSERIAQAIHKASNPTQRKRLIEQLEKDSSQIRALQGRIAQIASYRDMSGHRLDLIHDCEKAQTDVSRKLKEYHERLIKEARKPENLAASNADKDWSEYDALVAKIEKARTRVDVGARLFSDKTDVTMISEAQSKTLFDCLKVAKKALEWGNQKVYRETISDTRALYKKMLDARNFPLPPVPDIEVGSLKFLDTRLDRIEALINDLWGNGGKVEAFRNALKELHKRRQELVGGAGPKATELDKVLAKFEQAVTNAPAPKADPPSVHSSFKNDCRNATEALLAMYKTVEISETERSKYPRDHIITHHEQSGGTKYFVIDTKDGKGGTIDRRDDRFKHVPREMMTKLRKDMQTLNLIAQDPLPGQQDVLLEFADTLSREAYEIQSKGESEFAKLNKLIEAVDSIADAKPLKDWSLTVLGALRTEWMAFKTASRTDVNFSRSTERAKYFHKEFAEMQKRAGELKQRQKAAESKLKGLLKCLNLEGRDDTSAVGGQLATLTNSWTSICKKALGKKVSKDQQRAVDEIAKILKDLKGMKKEFSGVQGEDRHTILRLSDLVKTKTEDAITSVEKDIDEVRKTLQKQRGDLAALVPTPGGSDPDFDSLKTLLKGYTSKCKSAENDFKLMTESAKDAARWQRLAENRLKEDQANHPNMEALKATLEGLIAQKDDIASTLKKRKNAADADDRYQRVRDQFKQLHDNLGSTDGQTASGGTFDFKKANGELSRALKTLFQGVASVSDQVKTEATQQPEHKMVADKVREVLSQIDGAGLGQRLAFAKDRAAEMQKIADGRNAPDQRTARLALRETALTDLRGMRSTLNADPILRAYRTNPFDGATGWHQMVTTLNVIETDLLKTLAA